MTGVDYGMNGAVWNTVALLLTLAMCLYCVAHGIGQLIRDAATDHGEDVLTWCQGCGCRHRSANMDWDDEGRYRCVVCCRPDEEVTDETAPAA